MRRLLSLAICLLVAAPLNALAGPLWRGAGSSDDSGSFFDAASRHQTGPTTAEGWFATAWIEPGDAGIANIRNVSVATEHWSGDCANGAITLIHRDYFDERGRSVGHFTPRPPKPVPVARDQMSSVMLDLLCGRPARLGEIVSNGGPATLVKVVRENALVDVPEP